MIKEKHFTADVLVVGGGFAGVFAAIRAVQSNSTVILVDKGGVGKSGQTPFADGMTYFDATKGHKKTRWHELMRQKGNKINNPIYLDMMIEDSKNIFHELQGWGCIGNPTFGETLKQQLITHEVHLLQRVMLTHFIRQDDYVTGAMGFPLDEENTVIIIHAKAVVNCAGAGGYKPNGFPIP